MNQNQGELFEREPPPWELDDREQQLVASLVFSEGVDGVFDYLVPPQLVESAASGKRMKVPLGRGNRTVTGYCVDLRTKAMTRRLKEIHSVVDAQVLLSPHMLKLTSWIAENYLAPWGRVLETVLPAGVRDQAGTREKTFLSVADDVRQRFAELKLPEKQAKIIEYLIAAKQPVATDDLMRVIGCTMGPVNGLRKKKLVVEERRRIMTDEPEPLQRSAGEELSLNSDQIAAMSMVSDAIDANAYKTLLLHGVTGSGKTEIYIRAIERVVRCGRQAIVLVPEISLTPQTQRRFEARFDRVAVLHSHLSNPRRHWFWQQIASGSVQVVVGARSAVFAPIPNLGLIVIDEEHDGSFKQSTPPRYHTRDVAQKRAMLENIPLVLGSATPSLESWHRAKTGDYALVSMPNRVSKLPLPNVATVDMRHEYSKTRKFVGGIGDSLGNAIAETLRNRGQIILLLNRRGFSTHIQCPACGEVLKCQDCDIALTHHLEGNKAVCHYCDYESSAPRNCTACGFEGIRYGGLGTQRLEEEVNKRFPRAVCLRMDSDTMRRPGSHEAAFKKFRSGEVHILLGTQMIAKGLDFPNVTLVGVINADMGLHMPDFRAGERAFQLVTQVAGRTGRSERGGRVLVQSYNPDHASIRSAERHDYLGFAEAELPNRRKFGYPPFGAMVRIIARGENEDLTSAFATSLAEFLRKRLTDNEARYRLLGPAPAPISKLRGRFRFHMIIQSISNEQIRPSLVEAQKELKSTDEVQWVIDIDPIDML